MESNASPERSSVTTCTSANEIDTEHEAFQSIYEFVLPMDLADLDKLPDVVSKAFNWRKRIDFLFNNGGMCMVIDSLQFCSCAGIASRAPLGEFTIDKKVVTVDFLAPVYLAKLCLGHLLKSDVFTKGQLMDIGRRESSEVFNISPKLLLTFILRVSHCEYI